MRARSFLFRLFRVLLVLAVGIGVMVFLIRTKPDPEVQKPETLGTLVEVIEAKPETTTFTISGFGTIRPKLAVELVAQVGGKIVEKAPELKAGSLFQKDQVLFKIDPSDYALQVKQLEAQLSELTAETAQLKLQYENALEQRELLAREVQLAKAELEREKRLEQRDVAAPQEVERIERQAVAAQRQLQEAENTIKLFTPRENLLKARIEVAKAQLDQAKLQLERTEMRAPFTGRVLTLTSEPGEYVAPGKTIARVWSTDAIELVVNLLPEEVGWIIPEISRELVDKWTSGGFKAEAEVPEWVPRAKAVHKIGAEEYTWDGFVRGFEGQVEQNTRTVPIVIEIPDPWKKFVPTQHPPLVPGMFCRADIEGRRIDNVYRLPNAIVQPDNYVWIVADGRLHRKGVEPLRTTNEYAYVQPAALSINGGIPPLEKGDMILMTQLATPTEHMPVRVKSLPGKEKTVANLP